MTLIALPGLKSRDGLLLVGGGGGNAPAWVTALRAPSGDLPSTVLDFKNDRYWASGQLVTLAEVLVQNTDWGVYDTSAVVVDHGLGAFAVGANNAQPTVVRSILGDVLSSGATFLAIAELTAGVDQTDILVDVEFVALPGFESEYGSASAWLCNSSDPLPVSTAQVVNQTDNLTNNVTLDIAATGIHKHAATVTATGVARAIDGVDLAAVTATVSKDTAFTDVAIAVYTSFAASTVLSYLQTFAVYAPQPNEDLAALSALS